jgi:uncharacterized protein (DUF58 family)
VTFTPRLFRLLALGVLPLLLSSLYPPLALLGVLWNLLVGAAVVVDFLRSSRPEEVITARRIVDDALSVATTNAISLRVRNETAAPITITVRDEPPPEWAITEGTRQSDLALGAYEVKTLRYAVTPPARGNFPFGDVYARLPGPLGLIVRQGRISAAAEVPVLPNLRAVGDYELMLRRAHLVRTGARRTRVVGVGREFSALRDYTPDDEFRVIDWKATARRGKMTSRTFESERSQDILLLIDTGRLMRQEIAHTQKLDHVVSTALMLAHVAAEADDRVGLLTFADETRAWLPPRRGRAQVNDILDALYAARAEPLESDYRAAFRFLAARWRKRSLAVLFTDLADPESSAMLLAEIAQLARAHLVVCVVVRDPLVSGRARQMPDAPAEVYEKAVAEEVLADRRRALGILSRRGVLVVDAEPQELSAELVARYLHVKGRALL